MQDVRDALRALRATPLVTTVAVLSLALGIGANTAMFSIVDRLLLRNLPVPAAERLGLLDDGNWTNPIWEQIRDRPELFDGAFAWGSARFNLAAAGEAEYIEGVWASGRFFEVLGVPAILGRTFGPEDDQRGGGPNGPVAVISYRYWQSRYGGAADAVGRTISLNQTAFTIVGVTPPGFFGPEVGEQFDVVVPIGAEPVVRGDQSYLDRRSTWWLDIMVRVRPGQSFEQASAALAAVQPQIQEATRPTDWRPEDAATYLKDPLTIRPAAAGTSSLRERYRKPLSAIMVVVGLVLLIACGNIANLLLARATARRHEMSLRQALGASRGRLARQLLAESLLLSLGGAALGAFLAMWGSRFLVRAISTRTNAVFLDLTFDWRILAFTGLIAVATALLFGTAPALRAAGTEPIEAIKDQGRGGAADRRTRLAGGLVVAQVALSLVLVVGAGLFVRTFSSLAQLDLGFRDEGVLIVNVGAQRAGIPTEGRAAFFERIREAAAGVPGVESAALSFVTPVSGTRWNTRVEVPGGVTLGERESSTNVNYVSPEWIGTMGTPLRTGRGLEVTDRLGGPQVAVVNEAFVRHFLGDQPAVGRTIRRQSVRQLEVLEIVGVVGDAVYRSLREDVPPVMYLPLAQYSDPGTSLSLTVRARAGDPALLTRAVTPALLAVSPDLTLNFRTLSDQISASLAQERLVAMLSAFFGGLALLLAGLGLYGVTAYTVGRRRAEIGIRMALGAAPGRVQQLVLRRVAGQVVLGVVIGIGVSVWLSGFIGSLLYGLAPRDPLTLVLAAALLVAVGGAAGWLPARRASRVDPAVVLRDG